MDTIDVNNFKEKCKTGDYLLYHSTSIISRAIEILSKSKYSHVAMILRDPVWIDESLKGLYIIESGVEKCKDALSGKKVLGVQIVSLDYVLDQYLNSYFGNLYYVKVDTERDENFYNTLKDVIKSVDCKPYDLNLFDWIKAKFDIEIGNVHKENTFWCSALLSYIYVKLDLLPQSTPWTIIPPNKFSQYSKDKLVFQNSCVYLEQQIVKLKDKYWFNFF